MPHVTAQITAGGPILDFAIGVSGPRAEALQKSNEVVPPSMKIRGLIDTGASSTCVDPTCLDALGLSPTGQVPIHTPSTEAGTPKIHRQFDISLTLMHPGISYTFKTLAVVESHLVHQGYHALIGRDVLKNCLFVYNGDEETFSLAF